MKLILASLIFLLTNTCIAETFEEYLNNPQAQSKFAVEAKPDNVLDCGITIEAGSLKKFNEINKLCSEVVSKYRTSFPNYTVPSKISIPVSFLPTKTLVQYFGRRVSNSNNTLVKLDGFTDLNNSGSPKHFYVLSDWKSFFYFKTVFAHELFHVLNAMNHYDDSEAEAAAFTISIGLGK